MTKYTIILEPTNTGFVAHCAELPSCTVHGETREIAEGNIWDAIVLAQRVLRANNLTIPQVGNPMAQGDSIDLTIQRVLKARFEAGYPLEISISEIEIDD